MEARSYQVEMYKKAKVGNVIVKLNTGSGKTFIASMLIRDYLNEDNKVFLLVKNSSLAYQHEASLKEYLFLNNEIGVFYGQMENSWVDNWTKDKWSRKLSKYKIIIMTARVFLDILNHNKYNLDKISLLIFDEVHHLSKADDYAQISDHVIRRTSDIKILGLTACLIKGVKQLNEIEYNIMELERKLDCKVITSLNSIACEFSKNIKEHFIEFSMEDFSEITNEFIVAVEEIKSIERSFGNDDLVNDFDGFSIEESVTGSLKKYLNECSSVLKSLGLIPCKLIIDLFLEDIREAFSDNEIVDETIKLSIKVFYSCLKSVKCHIKDMLTGSSQLHCSPKCKMLIKFLYDLKSGTDDFANNISILIFINERIHVLALNELFLYLPRIHDGLDFINSQFITGHTTITFPKKLQMSVPKQSSILKDYKNKIFNILITTNVIEEGVDVSHCNVVIKFDPPQDFRSYIQSKGRARAEDSLYLIFTSEKFKTEYQIKHFKMINNKINEFLRNRIIDNEFDCYDSDSEALENEDSRYDFIPFGKNGPRITLNSASSVLNRYVGKLRCNAISETKILYKFRCNDDSQLFEASLLLPMPSPYLDPIIGKPCSNKRRAKLFANLKACQILHEYDELDEFLLPYNRYEEEIDSDPREAQSVINRYEIPTAIKLGSEFQKFQKSGNRIYLYSIRYKPSIYLNLGINNISVFDTSYSLGILLAKPIHEVASFVKFPIYLVGGECMVEIKFERFLEINSNQLSLFLKCHEKLFLLYSQRIRKFHQNISFQANHSKSSLIVTILKDYDIDFDTISKMINKELLTKLVKNDKKSWVGSVIRPTYAEKEYGAFVVTKVCYDMNASSTLCRKNISYEQNYSEKHKLVLTEFDRALPLIRYTRLTTIQSCINKERRSIKNNRRLQKINESDIYMIPSFAECISLSASLWTELCIFPTIHHRLNQICVIKEFTEKINFMDLINSPKCFQVDFHDCNNFSNIESEQLSLCLKDFMMNVFPCFIAKTCNDRADLELFEILGDSFLKYITAKYLYHFSNIFDNEGKLTQKRSRLISNKNLFNLAIKRELNKYFFYTNFNPKTNYLPPNFVENDNQNNDIPNKRVFVSMKNKNLADCVEALIGSIYTNYGIDYCLKFLSWLGLALLPDGIHSFDIKVDPPESFNKILITKGIPIFITELEQILDYEFKNKGFAIQAITHPSSIENRKFSCYQRLEFLGDSVIDFLITQYIMITNNNLNPGKITSLRSALVNNNTFAYLSVKWGFHKFLNYLDSKMFYVLPKVVEEVLANKLESNGSFLIKQQQYKVVVKVLGDIFESIAGAIFVDSNYDLNVVWAIYKRLMDEPLNKFKNHIPRNKISILHERFPSLKCIYEIEEHTNLVKLTATLLGNRVIEKKERNKILCKLALAEELHI